MANEPMVILDNIKLWKDILDKDEDKICNGMTQSEHKAYKLGIDNLFNLFWRMLESNCEEGYYTVLYPDENIKPQEFAPDEFMRGTLADKFQISKEDKMDRMNIKEFAKMLDGRECGYPQFTKEESEV